MPVFFAPGSHGRRLHGRGGFSNRRHRVLVLNPMKIFGLFALLAAVFPAVCGAGPVRIVEAGRSPEIRGAAVRVVSPPDGGRIFTLSPEITLDVSGFELGSQTRLARAGLIANSPEGQHIHLIVDDKPYKAIYDVSKPVRIGRLLPGRHTVVVFPSRSYHESVKAPGAAHTISFSVFSSPVAPSHAPGIIYSRPKGMYKGDDTRRVMVDFYLRGVSLSRGGHTVRVTVLGEGGRSEASVVLDEWRPVFVEGLENGTYTFVLDLLDPGGKAVASKKGKAEIVR